MSHAPLFIIIPSILVHNMVLSSLTDTYQLSWLEKCAVEVIKLGPIPKHVGIILDGNRRYARERNMENVIDGHRSGAEKLEQVAQMLVKIGVEELTVYAFSIENFKRAKKEVDGLMELLKTKAHLTNEKYTKAKEKQVCVEVIGNLHLAPTKDIETSLKKNMLLSKEWDGFKINLAFIYTGRNEIMQGANYVIQGLSSGLLDIFEVTEEVLQGTFTLHPSNPLDILVRTSGECRLSDFLIWGSSEAHIEFIQGTWPEFSFWNLVGVIFRYQNQLIYRNKNFKGLKTRGSRYWEGGLSVATENGKQFVDNVRRGRWEEIAKSIKGEC